jgi:Second BRCT domain on Nijmegen syndrome breakage protein/FHA domain
MWILESNADFLQGKRMWLKPGKKYLFGRVKRDGVRFGIDHKTISRKHFVIAVDEVKPGDVSRIHARSRVTITDEKSKQGTFVDGELLKDDTRELTKPEHSIRPGAFHHELMIRWQPCVLTFSFTKKEIKADALKSKRERLEELDIKVVADYLNASTTHVIAGKRNTAKGLQAIVQGKYIVADSYVDALIYAATPADLGEEENLSPLELDFDTAWPKEADHLPPAGKEPTTRPAESYAPNQSRSNVFENFVFIFGDQTQYDNLLPPITLGHGKALLYKIVNGDTTADELVEYMHNAAGQKGFGDARKDSDKGGVILVRWMGRDQYSDWTQSLINDVALKLKQRAIDQADFLDAILANDASTLRRAILSSTVGGGSAPPPTAVSIQSIRQASSSAHQQRGISKKDPIVGLLAPSSHSLPPAPPTSSATQNAESHSIPSRPEPAVNTHAITRADAPATTNSHPGEAPLPPKKSRLRGVPIPKFTDFDDGFDPDSIPSYTAEDYLDSQPPFQSQFQSREQSHTSRDASAAPHIKDEPPASTRKRRHSPSPSADVDSMNDDMDDILPAATAMKRRKLASETGVNTNGRAVPKNKGSIVPPLTDKTKLRKKEKEIDVLETVKAQREAEEEAARRERLDLAEGLGYENDEKKPADLVVVMTMELPVRKGREAEGDSGEARHSDRWDPKWNGRKNFKRFRKIRVGDGGSQERSMGHQHQVIVPLVEVKRNTYGFGEKFWDRNEGGDGEEGGSKRKKSGRKGGRDERVSQLQSHTQDQSQSRSQIGKGERMTQPAQTHTQMISSSTSNPDDANPDADTQNQSQSQSQIQNLGEAKDESSNEEAASTSSATAHLKREAAAIVEHAINPDMSRRTRLTDKTQSQKLPSQVAGSKRPATTGKTGAVKKQKTIPTVVKHGSDSEDSDDLKFRFGRRGKTKG